jgi:NDP-sugar pyrophosphorylase family protein
MMAIILVAGQGTRLRPLTNDKPKCLVELAGKPLLEHQLETLRARGVEDIHIVGGYRADQLQP